MLTIFILVITLKSYLEQWTILSHLNDWFCDSEFCLNIDKTTLRLFTNYAKAKRDDSLKFLGVMIDENLTWKT